MPKKEDVQEFLNPKSGVAPAAAGGLVAVFSATIAYQFEIKARIVALVASLILGIASVATGQMKRWVRVIYAVVNSMVVFTISAGAYVTADNITVTKPQLVSAQQSLLSISLLPNAHAAPVLPATVREGELVRSGDTIFLVADGRLRQIPDFRTLIALGFEQQAIRDVEAATLRDAPVGLPYPPLTSSLVRGKAASVYFLQTGKRRLIPDNGTFDAMGFQWKDVSVVTDDELNLIPQGAPLAKKKRFLGRW